MIVITLGLIGGQFIKTTFFPRMEFDSFNINIAFTPGSGEKQTMEYLEKFDSIVWVVNEELMEEYEDTIPIIENSIIQLGSAFGGAERGAHAGSVDRHASGEVLVPEGAHQHRRRRYDSGA